MNKQEFNEMIEKVLSQGIEVSIAMDMNTKIIWYNMNTMMKSELLIAHDGEMCIFKARYDHKGIINDYDDLLDEIRDCEHGREFGNETWFEILKNRYN